MERRSYSTIHPLLAASTVRRAKMIAAAGESSLAEELLAPAAVRGRTCLTEAERNEEQNSNLSDDRSRPFLASFAHAANIFHSSNLCRWHGGRVRPATGQAAGKKNGMTCVATAEKPDVFEPLCTR